MTIGAMILAAGRGERMRPLSDTTPKPLLEAGGKPLVVWQIEALARAGLTDIVINVAHLPEQFVTRLGDGRELGVNLVWSIESEALEAAGGIAAALPLLPEGPAIIVSADVWTAYDYAPLVALATAMARDSGRPRAHLVMVPNPPYHPAGDFAFAPDTGGARGWLAPGGAPQLTYGNIGLYDLALFRELPRGVKLKLAPLLVDWIGRGFVSAELHTGPWANVGTPEHLAQLDAQLRQPASSHAFPPSFSKSRSRLRS